MYDCIGSDEVAGIRLDAYEAARLRDATEPCPEGCGDMSPGEYERALCDWCEGDAVVTPEVLEVWLEVAHQEALEAARGGWSRRGQSGEFSDLARFWRTPVLPGSQLCIVTYEAGGRFRTVTEFGGRAVSYEPVLSECPDGALAAHCLRWREQRGEQLRREGRAA